jgi:hypothetical protein
MSIIKEMSKTVEFWAAIILLICIALLIKDAVDRSQARHAPNYDPCQQHVDFPLSGAECYEDLIRMREAKAKFFNIKSDGSK